ncbi:MAG: T9SS type A sorting domain-containing protein, partial [Paludibacter sp.]
FVQEESSISSDRRLYSINDIAVTNVDATMSFGLKVGTKVKFAANIYLSRNDSSVNTLCYTIGAVTCWEVISSPPSGCILNKVGVVVAGIDGCAGRLFIEDTSYMGMNMIRQLYAIENSSTSNGVVSIPLKVGDKVRFGGYYTNKNDTSINTLCYIVGVATCYELVNAESAYILAGSAVAGNELLKSGYAVLIQKGHYKAAASSVIVDGKFIFKNLPKAEYTVYVIPDIRIYKNYLPTFYSNKLMFKKADYVALSSNIDDLVVKLRQFVLPTGTGKIYGNIFFETYSLKDSILNKDESQNNSAMNTIAFNTPVVLYNAANEPIAWTLTDILGNYVFENIALETYKVVSETAAAIAESVVVLTAGNSTMNADLLLKSQLVDTGVNTIENNVIELYPNPVIDNLKVNLKEAATVDVYNVLGKILIHAELQSGDNVLDLSQIAKGVYYTKIGKSSFKIVKK